MSKTITTFNIIGILGSITGFVLMYYNFALIGLITIIISALIFGGLPAKKEILNFLKRFSGLIILMLATIYYIYLDKGKEFLFDEIFLNKFLIGIFLVAGAFIIFKFYTDKIEKRAKK